jgi:hypothetical protein
LQNSFWIAEDKLIMWGTTAISDEFTGNLGSAFEDNIDRRFLLGCSFRGKIAASHVRSFATPIGAKRTLAVAPMCAECQNRFCLRR